MPTHSRKTAIESGQAQPRTTKSIFTRENRWIVELWSAHEEYPYLHPFDSEVEARAFFQLLDAEEVDA